MKRKKSKPKMFVVRTYVMAINAPDAMRKAKKMQPDDVYVSDDWKEGKLTELASAIGFEAVPPKEEDE